MKKIIAVTLISLLFLSACNFSVDFEGESGKGNTDHVGGNNEEKEALQLQMTKVDEEAGVTVESNETYQLLDEFVKENPKFGVANDFSMQSITMVMDSVGNQQMLFLAVNRLGEPIKNVDFNLSLGNTKGDVVWENLSVTIDEEVAGVIENNAAVPIFLPITSEEQVDLMNTISQENLHIELKDFNYDTTE